MTTGMEERISAKLAQGLQTSVLDIVNYSARHAGHGGDDGSGESHFRVLAVSAVFAGKGRIERQRMVYALLDEELRSGAIHALTLQAMTPEEYDRV